MGTDDWISTSYTPDSRMIPRKRLRQQIKDRCLMSDIGSATVLVDLMGLKD